MTREEIKEGLRFTVDMFKLDPLTGEERTLNEHDATTVNACEEAIKVIDDFEALNAINLDLASENEDLVERIGKLIGYIDFLRNVGTGKKKSLNLLEKVVKGELEEIRAEGENFVKPKTGEWIPVSERLPKEHICDDGFIEPSVSVLVQLNNKEMKVSRYWGSRERYKDKPWIDLSYPTTLEVVAWMPLPESYKEVSE